jgi:hypothetical protein
MLNLPREGFILVQDSNLLFMCVRNRKVFKRLDISDVVIMEAMLHFVRINHFTGAFDNTILSTEGRRFALPSLIQSEDEVMGFLSRDTKQDLIRFRPENHGLRVMNIVS